MKPNASKVNPVNYKETTEPVQSPASRFGMLPLGLMNGEWKPRDRVLYAGLSAFGWSMDGLMATNLTAAGAAELLGWKLRTTQAVLSRLGIRSYAEHGGIRIIGPIPKNFAKIPLDHPIWAMKPEVVCLFAAITRYTEIGSGACWANGDTLAEAAGIPAGQVRRYAKILADAGFIDRTMNFPRRFHSEAKLFCLTPKPQE